MAQHRPRSDPTSPSAWWLAAGAGLVGVLFGAAAVYLGVVERGDLRPLPPPAPAVAAPAEPIAVPAQSAEPSEAKPSAANATPSLADAVATTRDAVVNLGAVSTLGAGVIVDAEGTIITNHHVIADALRIPRSGMFVDGAVALAGRQLARPTVVARFEDGRELPALVVVADADQDLAILRLIPDDENERFSAVALGSSAEVRVGQEVFAIGNPFGLSHTVSRGIVSAIDRTSVLANRVPVLQLDASINTGNSGGPLFDLQGRLLGIVTAKNREANGIAFAVPVDHLRAFLRAVADDQGGRSGAIGIELSTDGDLPAPAQSLGYDAGLVIGSVEAGSPADTAGVQVGDVLVEVRGKRLDGLPEAGDPVALATHVVASVRSLFAGETLVLSVVRDGALVPISVEVGAATPRRQAMIDAEELLGLRLKASAGTAGPAEVDTVLPHSPLAPLSSRLPGTQVVTMMDRDVRSTEELGVELARIRALVRQQQGPVEVLVGFSDREGQLIGEVHVVVG